METIKELVDLLTLERISDTVFTGKNYKAPWGRIFGGQVLAQALHAAYQTVPEDRYAHSMHGYFILTGHIEKPITYEVDITRDGGSFTTRRVAAIQDGKKIFVMASSFQKEQEGFDHQINMPNVLPPEVLLPDYEQLKILKEHDPLMYRRLTGIYPNAIEFRSVENYYKTLVKSALPFRNVWIKSVEEIDIELPMQHQILAYASDFKLLATAALPHNERSKMANMFFASLDHAIWFHRKFRIDEWLLYSMDSPSASNSRGFTRGNIFNKDGKLIASVVQEGLMRQMKKK